MSELTELEREERAQAINGFILKHGVSTTAAVAGALGLSLSEARVALDRLASAGRVFDVRWAGDDGQMWISAGTP